MEKQKTETIITRTAGTVLLILYFLGASVYVFPVFWCVHVMSTCSPYSKSSLALVGTIIAFALSIVFFSMGKSESISPPKPEGMGIRNGRII